MQKLHKYNGTLLKGDMFTVSFVEGKIRKQMVEPFNKMGQYYAKNNYFNKEVVNIWASEKTCSIFLKK